ncbi:MAG: hypothetical protein OEV29_07290, partial [Thermoleophilia bacterium]|nr:hypothetical protein [Thermoleophilia bacterium]
TTPKVVVDPAAMEPPVHVAVEPSIVALQPSPPCACRISKPVGTVTAKLVMGFSRSFGNVRLIEPEPPDGRKAG